MIHNLSQSEALSFIKKSKSYKVTSRRSWARDVKNIYKRTCLLSGLKEPEILLHCHHLNCVALYPHLELSILNGIPLAENIHKDFHRRFGQNVTAKSFIEYITLLATHASYQERIRLLNVKAQIKRVEFLDTAML